MVAIPKPPQKRNLTLEAVDEAIEHNYHANWKPRMYMGMSGIGNECERVVWGDFVWAAKDNARAFLIKASESGYTAEDLQAERLRMVDGIKLTTHIGTQQIEFSDLGGHFKGHCDGSIEGILEAPKTIHIWEHKESNPEKWVKVDKLVDKYGEKNALEHWDFNYYVQSQLYMHYSGYGRHYITVTMQAGRFTTAIRTNYDKNVAETFIRKAERLISAKIAPARPSNFTPDWWLCRNKSGQCKHYNWCHGDDALLKNCRTCKHSAAWDDGAWKCNKYDAIMYSRDEQLTMSICGGGDYEQVRVM